MTTRLRYSLFTLLLLLAGIVTLQAQRTPQNPDPGIKSNPIGSSNIRDTFDSGVLPLETPITMSYVVISDPDDVHSFMDTFLWEDNAHFPLPYHYGHLGNYGSPARSLAPSINMRHGFSTGWDQYDRYYESLDSFRYYTQNVPVAKAKFSQAGQKDSYFTLDFGRGFANGTSLSLAYDRINQQGEFAHQIQRNTSFGLGIWHDAPSGRYDAFYNYISNTAVGEENGGIYLPESLGLDPDLIVPVFLLNGITTHKHRVFTTRQILHLITDTTNIGIDLWLQGNYNTGLFKYVDERATDLPAPEYYGDFLIDERGIRQFTFQKEYQVAAGIGFPWRATNSSIETSLRYRSINLVQEPVQRKINELYLDAEGKFNWIEPLDLKGSMSFGLGQATGAFAFSANGILKTGLIGNFEGNWSVSTRKPYLIESRLFINQQLVYDFNFQNPFTTEFGVQWNWEKQNLKAGIKWIVYDNFIFFDATRMPSQLEQPFSLRRYYLIKAFDFKWFGIKGDLIFQPDVKTEVAIPEFIMKGSLYGRVKIFRKKVTLMPGIDMIYHDAFAGVSYFPVTGRYHLTDGPMIPEYVRIDAAIGVHINFLKLFVRYEDFVPRDRVVLYQADYYPHYRKYFRIGVETGFFN